MHRSRLSTFVIDCHTDDLVAAARFWSEALGREVLPPDDDSGRYRELESTSEEPMLLVQQVEHPGRVHLDIESDDLEAEVARLEALGAKRIGFVKRWWVMEAPTGQRFCVVNPQRGPLGADANVWGAPAKPKPDAKRNAPAKARTKALAKTRTKAPAKAKAPAKTKTPAKTKAPAKATAKSAR